MAETRYVRIRPRDKKKGHTCQRYHHRGLKMTFEEAHGFYHVPLSVADAVRHARQNRYDPESPTIFEVYSEEDALALLAQAKRQEVKQRMPTLPAALTLPPADRAAIDRKRREIESAHRRKEVEALAAAPPTEPVLSDKDERVTAMRARYKDLTVKEIVEEIEDWPAQLLQGVLDLEAERESPRSTLIDHITRRLAAFDVAAEAEGDA